MVKKIHNSKEEKKFISYRDRVPTCEKCEKIEIMNIWKGIGNFSIKILICISTFIIFQMFSYILYKFIFSDSKVEYCYISQDYTSGILKLNQKKEWSIDNIIYSSYDLNSVLEAAKN